MPIQTLDSGVDWSGNSGNGGGGGGNGVPTGGTYTPYSDAVVPETGTVQVLLGEGRMEGLVNGLQSVFLDGTPIQNSDLTLNFKGVALALVAGTNTQPAVKGITDTESETSVNVQVLNGTPVVRSITSGPSAVRVRIAIPTMQVVSTTDGKSSGNTVSIQIERQNASWNGGAWETLALEGSGVISGGPYTTKLTKAYRVDLPASGTWQVRVTRISPNDPDAYHASQTWWDAYTEIVDATLRYPNSSVLSLRVNAKQFQSIPQITVHMNLMRVMIPANYTPASYNWATGVWTAAVYRTTGTGTSGGVWDGTFVEAWSSNPAWVFYDAATKTRYGAGTFLSTSGLDKWALYAIAQWCDAMVADGKGGTEPRMVANLYIQSQQNAITALSQLCSVFCGVVYYASGLVTPVADADQSPVALFTNSNVTDGKFVYEGTARQARHTAAICKFSNPELGYASDTAVYEDEVGVARYGYNALDLQAIGCTSQGQAMRLAKWAILTELMASETCSFSSGLEGSTVKPGDVVQVADQFRAGNTRSGGRVVSATTTVITLDAPVTLGAGAYTLRCQTAAGMESKTVTTGAGTTSTLTVASAFSSAPIAGAGWLLQSGTTASLWRVVSVTKGTGLGYAITALLHDPTKYTALGLTAGDVVPRTIPQMLSPAPTGLAITNSVRILNDRQVQTLSASWTLDKASGYIAKASRDYGPWIDMTVTGATAILDDIQPGSWRVQVCGDWKLAGLSPVVSTTATITASGTQPPFVGNINSVDYLAVIDQITLLRDWNNEANVKTQLDTQATALSITTEKTTYDNAVAALSTSLISAGAPGGWASGAWPSTVFGPVTGIMTSLAGWWATIATARTALINKIAVATGALGGTTATWGSITGASAQASPAGGWTGAATFASSVSMSALTVSRAIAANDWNAATIANAGSWTSASGYAALVNVTDGSGTVGAFGVGYNGQGYFVIKNLYYGGYAGSGEVFRIQGSGAATFASSVSMGALTATSGVFSAAVTTQNGLSGSATSAGLVLGGWDSTTAVPNIAANWPSAGYWGIGPDTTATDSTVRIGGTTSGGAWNGGTVNLKIAGALMATTGTFSGAVSLAANMTGGYGTSFGSTAIATKAPFFGNWTGSNYFGIFGDGNNHRINFGMTDSTGAVLSYPGDMSLYVDGSLVLTLGNVGTNAATLQAAVASATAPKVGTHAQMVAFAVPTGTTPYWYATDDLETDGLYGKLWQWNGSAWVAVGTPSTIAGRVTAGVISAGAVGAQAIAADVALVGQVLRNTGFTAGTSSVAPSGFKFSGTAFSATLLDGTSLSVYGEIGADFSVGGLKAAVIANRVKGNNFTRTTAGTTDVFIPDGVVSIEVTLQAAGGNGASGYGYGGNGGQYIKQTVTVKPHNTYRITAGAVGSNSTFTWVSFDGTSGFTSDSGFGGLSATCGASGSTSAGTGANGTSVANPFPGPESGWNVGGGTGGDGAAAASGIPSGTGGGVGALFNGGNGQATTGTKQAGGGGGASVLASGGSGGQNPANGTAGTLGSGGGSGAVGGAGGAAFCRVKW